MDEDIATVVAFAIYGQASRYAHAATYAATVYDWFLCIGEDVDLLLTPGHGFAKLAYFSCRYLLLLSYPITLYVQAMDHPLAICVKTFRIPMVLAIPNLGAAVSLLTLRLYAFTGGNFVLVVVIALSYLALSTYHLWVVFARSVRASLSYLRYALIRDPTPIVSPLGPAGHGCVPAGKGNNFELSGIFFGAFLLDTFVTVCFIIHVVREVKLKYTHLSLITRTCLRQGVLYFLAISAVNLLNVVSFIQPYKPFAGINVPFSLGLPSILACRMFLGLRKAGRDITMSTSGTSAGLTFARRPVSASDGTWVPSLTLPDSQLFERDTPIELRTI